MSAKLDVGISRRSFLASASAAAAVAFVAPRRLFAQDDGLVQTARRTASTDTVTVQKLRGNISVLLGAGGNIAVLTGPDGKLLIDAGFAGARPQITNALASINSDPIKHLINTHWHFDHTDGNECALSRCSHPRSHQHPQAPLHDDASGGLELHVCASATGSASCRSFRR